MTDTLTPDLIDRVDQIVHVRMAERNLPGVALGIVGFDGLLWFRGIGRVDLDRSATPTVDSVARVASVTKTFTMSAILQLRDEGRLRLDDSLTAHIPEFENVVVQAGRVEDVTIRRLLTHHSGLVTEPPTPSWDALAFPSIEQILEHLSKTEVVIPQDSAWKYSNLAFGLLGEVVHRVSGQPYVDYVQENLLDPLGMSSTAFDLDAGLRKRFLTGYKPSRFEDRPSVAPYAHLAGLTSAGQMHSTVADLAKWVSVQFRLDGGPRAGAQVLAGETLAEIQRPQYVSPDWSTGQCLGWRAVRVGDHVYHQHGGGIHGFATQVWFNVPERVGIVLFVTLWPAQVDSDIAREIMELLVAINPVEARASVPPEPAPDALRRFLGSYRAEPGIGVEVVYRDGALRLDAPAGSRYSLHAPAELEPTETEDAWLVIGGRGAGERAIFRFDEDGTALNYALGGFVFRRQ